MSGSAAASIRGNATTAQLEQLASLRAMLMRERDFRREQLEGRERRRGTSTTGPTCEVQDILDAGAQRALEDIELALCRIASGRYGRCRACDAEIPLALLQAVPQTTLCLPCLQPADSSGSSDTPAAAWERRGQRDVAPGRRP